MSEDLSSESESWRANTPAWHPLPTGFTVTFSERARVRRIWGGWGESVNGVIFTLDLLVLPVTQKSLFGIGEVIQITQYPRHVSAQTSLPERD